MLIRTSVSLQVQTKRRVGLAVVLAPLFPAFSRVKGPVHTSPIASQCQGALGSEVPALRFIYLELLLE